MAEAKIVETMSVRVASDGRMVLPKAICAALGLKDGGVVVMLVVDDQVHLTSMASNIAAAQAYDRAHVVSDQNTDEFLAQRRIEALAERRFKETE